MPLRELLGRIAETYDQRLGFDSEAQRLLRICKDTLGALIPAGYLTDFGGGRGFTAAVPWLRVFDPDETGSAQRGMYLVYLFAADMSTIYLCLAQGITDLTEEHGWKKARELLRTQADAVRNALDRDDLDMSIDLRSQLSRPRSYEASVILAKAYEANALPEEAVLVDDLGSFLTLYQDGLALREALRSNPNSPIATAPPSTSAPAPTPRAGLVFKPKDDSDYVQAVAARTVAKSRKHETLLRSYGEYLRQGGFAVGTNVHPRDMVAERSSAHWLVEAKIIYRGDGIIATRDALSQLLMYRDFLYPSDAQIGLLAVFNEPVGNLCAAFLDRHEITPVWREAGCWLGSLAASAHGLCERTGSE